MSTSFRLATFNLESLGDGDRGGPPLAPRLSALRPLLLALEAEVVCLQEVNAVSRDKRPRQPEGLEALIAGTPYAEAARCLSLGVTGTHLADRHNLAILSRLPIRSWQSLHHAFVPPLDLPLIGREGVQVTRNFDRPLLFAELELADGRMLHLLNLHLRAPLAAAFPGGKREGTWRDTAAWAEGLYHASLLRSAQALEARLLVERIFDAEPEALIAVCGDFNAEGEAAALEVLAAPPAKTGLAESAGRALVTLDPGLSPERRFSLRHAGQALMVDHILVSPALFAGYRGIDSLNAHLVDDCAQSAGAERGSFHAPLVAAFDL
ncbi:endonuclease/exonuclease/phosphatase family protein [Algihabitans albus]|uniref:endonuclease/exonuclease/phosphatase family protein n=1 Tax=Algihabitans albus TaxID=2164067 RepID=UPI000E5CA4DF|nr:endonuclease/exonuclease/phosphatase family protein [Algihabitans albus]